MVAFIAASANSVLQSYSWNRSLAEGQQLARNKSQSCGPPTSTASLSGSSVASTGLSGGFGDNAYDFIDLGVWGKPRYDDDDDGSFDGLYRTRFQDVTDGLSNTLMIGEMAGRPDIYKRGEPDEP